MRKLIFALLFVLLLFLILIAVQFYIPFFNNQKNVYLDYFDMIWQTVKEQHFDPTFGGLDWDRIRDQYRPLMGKVENDQNFYPLINRMLFRLSLSHLRVIPPGDWGRLEPELFAEGSAGIDIRFLNNAAVITSIEPGSPAEEAGLRPSQVIEKIDGIPIETIAGERLDRLEPPYNKQYSITNEIQARIYGLPETSLSITCREENGGLFEKSIMRKSREGKTPFGDILPPAYIAFEANRQDGDIGYLRFNCFHPALREKIRNAVASMADAPGLIIDLRGNSGGSRAVVQELAGHFVRETTLLFSLKTRAGKIDVVLDPVDRPYEGPVVVLLDVMSQSASEYFAAALQAAGRVVVIGERSSGAVNPMALMPLPNGAIFIYPYAELETPGGAVIDGHGVEPDIPVELDRTALSRGRDSQLEAAIHFIKEKTEE